MSKFYASALSSGAITKARLDLAVMVLVVGSLEYAFHAGLMDPYIGNAHKVLIIPSIVVGAIALVISLLLNVPTLISALRYKKQVKKYTESVLLEEMNNCMIQSHRNENGRKIFITARFLISPDICILETSQIAWQYILIKKNVPYFVVRTLDGKEHRPGIVTMTGTTDKACVEALRRANPGMLIGYSEENEKLYEHMVKEHKKD